MMAPNAQRRSEKSHQAILAAAMDLSAERGYGNVTVEAIAARAGVSKKTIYRWWPTKGAVILEALGELAQTTTTFPDTGDLVADLRTQTAAVLDFLASPRTGSAYLGLIAETQHDEALARDLVEQLIKPRVAVATDRLRSAQRQGQLSAEADLELIVELLYGPIYYRRLLHLGPHADDRLHALIDHVLSQWR
ncbi:TetR/AcrR family transcriptional regulator [Nonomuraea roseola]|uniref:TetR/AcrR family transcriptional regulator n=1 Tax=Nonomuraea roseola TaxID=46179 RepID=A0ABV5Q8L6_9ACTN